MQRHAARLLHSVAIAVAVAALVPAAVIAGRFGPGTPSGASAQSKSVPSALGTCHQYCDTLHKGVTHTGGRTPFVSRPRIVTVVASSAFSWSDAAIGFGAACGLALLALGALAYRRRGAIPEIREAA